MSPQIALHDPIFLSYLRIVFVSLALGGVVLGTLHWGLKKDIDAMWRTYCSWLIIAPLSLAVIIAGRIPTIIGITLLAIFGFKEFARASGLYRDWWMTGAVYAGILTVGIASLMPHPRGEEPGTGWYGFFVAVPVFAIALILIVAFLLLPIDRRIHLHRLDVWTSRLRCQRDERLRLSLLHYFRDRVERRSRLHFRKNVRPTSASQ